MHDDRRELSAQELATEEVVDLPDRQAMSLIGTLPHLPTGMPLGGDGGLTGGTPTDATSPTDSGGVLDPTLSDPTATQSDGVQTLDSPPRNEVFTNSDSASSTT